MTKQVIPIFAFMTLCENETFMRSSDIKQSLNYKPLLILFISSDKISAKQEVFTRKSFNELGAKKNIYLHLVLSSFVCAAHQKINKNQL